MRSSKPTALRLVWLFLLAPLPLVHCLAPAPPALAQAAKAKAGGPKKQQIAQPAPGEISYATDRLPGPVQEMREAILGAVRSGRIEDLRHAYEMNELKPDLGDEPVTDPIAYWKRISGDGEGREILAALGEALEAGYVVLPTGRDLENNRIYVWPYFAEIGLGKLTPAQEVELLRLVPAAAVKQMKAAGKYTSWRIAIGADGVWHSFRKGP